MCETDEFQKVKVDTVEQIQLQIHLNKYWGVSAGLDWNLPLERFGNVSIKKTNVSHRVDKLWEMAVPALFTAPQHTTIVFVQYFLLYLYNIFYCICTLIWCIFCAKSSPCLLSWSSVGGLFLKHGFNEAGFDREFNLFASNHICPRFWQKKSDYWHLNVNARYLVAIVENFSPTVKLWKLHKQKKIFLKTFLSEKWTKTKNLFLQKDGTTDKSPLQMLAQTCSQIGADSGPKMSGRQSLSSSPSTSSQASS